MLGLRAALIVLVAVVAGGCGGDDAPVAQTGAADSRATPRVDLSEARRILEAGPVELTREATSGRSSLAVEVEPRPVDSSRLTTQRGPEFHLLSFASSDAARRAWQSVLDTDVIANGGVAVRSVNLVAVFERPARDDVYRVVVRRLRALAVACGDPNGDPELRGACFDDAEGGVPPAGEGTGLDEMARIGATVHVGGVAYEVTTARQLNPSIEPDSALVGDHRDGPRSLLFGVFVRACNASGRAATPTDRMRIVNAFGRETRPVDLPSRNPFAFEPRKLEPQECLPAPGSPADRTIDGALVLFELPSDRLDERPLGLEIISPDGTERAIVQVDV